MAAPRSTKDLDELVVQVEGLDHDLEDNRAGSGAYGFVFRVTVKGRECIAKKLHYILLKAGDYYPVDQRDSIIEKFRNECRILSGLDHPNVVTFVGVHYGRDKNDLSLIMERMQTDLAAFVQSHPQTPIAERIHILWEVSKGLQYLHSLTPPLIHRDLTAPNVLLTDNLTAKIGDLGMSRYVDLDALSRLLTKAPGNVYYMSPEAREDNPLYTVKLDIFSFGTLIIHTFIGQVPALHDVPYNQQALKLSEEGKIELTKRRKAIQQMTKDHCMYPLIARCLHDKPAPRPIADELYQSLKELCTRYPTKAFQKVEIETALRQRLKEGDTWYLIGFRWMEQWKRYVGYNEKSSPGDGSEAENPGKMNNDALLTGGILRDDLKDKNDYSLVPESAWNKLVSWYGLSSNSKAISRKVVLGGHGLMVEVYLQVITLSVYPSLKEIKCRNFSRSDTIATLMQGTKDEFGIPAEVDCRAHCYVNSTFRLLSDDSETLQKSGLFEDQSATDTIILVLEKQNDDGTWPQVCSPQQQKLEIEAVLEQKLRAGESWFLVDANWMRKWKSFVSTPQIDMNKPGPVENSRLCKYNDMRLYDNLMAGFDYTLVPKSAWNKLCFWYGLSPQSMAMSRRVVECGTLASDCFVEVYLLKLKMCIHPHLENVKTRKFSRADTVGDLESAIREEFSVSPNIDSDYICCPTLENKKLHPNSSLLGAGLHSGQTVLLQTVPPPSLETQRTEMQTSLKQQLKDGDIWYLVDIHWMKQWKKYVGYDTWDQSSAGKESANPGPLDNSNLLKDDHLCEHLMDELHYYLVPKSAWNKLESWYGLSLGSKAISRQVVEYGLYMKHLKVEVYLLEFKLCVHPDLNAIRLREFSRNDTVADLESAIREEFHIPSAEECRVWHRYMTNTYELLSKADHSLQYAGLYNGQTIVLEMKNEDGSWPRSTSVVRSRVQSRQ